MGHGTRDTGHVTRDAAHPPLLEAVGLGHVAEVGAGRGGVGRVGGARYDRVQSVADNCV